MSGGVQFVNYGLKDDIATLSAALAAGIGVMSPSATVLSTATPVNNLVAANTYQIAWRYVVKRPGVYKIRTKVTEAFKATEVTGGIQALLPCITAALSYDDDQVAGLSVGTILADTTVAGSSLIAIAAGAAIDTEKISNAILPAGAVLFGFYKTTTSTAITGEAIFEISGDVAS